MAPLHPLRPHHTDTPQDGLLSSAFRHLPFSSPRPPSPKPSVPDPTALASAADRLLRDLSTAASNHPLIKALRYLRSDFQSFLQVRCRNPRNVIVVSAHNFAAILPGDSVAGLVVANGLNSFLNLYNTLLVVRLVLTWFPNSPPAIVSPLSTVCDPYLNIFRGLIPPLGGLDLSPILAFLVLNAFTSTAAALPAELPVTAASQQHRSYHPLIQNLTATQEKWMRRMSLKRPNHEDGK